MGTAARKKRELEHRKQLILEKSRELFFQKGYDGVTIQDICKAVEYGRSAIYGLFQSKEEIYAHLKLRGIAKLADQYMVINPDAADRDVEFIQCARILHAFYEEHRPYYRAVFGGQSGVDARISPELRTHMDSEMGRAWEPLHLLLSKGMESGYFDDSRSADSVVRLFWSALVGIINGFIVDEREDEKSRIAEACVQHAEIYLAGLKKS